MSAQIQTLPHRHDERSAVYLQSFAVPYEFPVYFTEHLFAQDNPVFRGFASRHPGAAEEHRPRPGQRGWMPVVPVAEHLRVPRLLPDWPRGALDPASLLEPMRGRLGPLLRRIRNAMHASGLRVEDDRVFDAVHALPLRLFAAGVVATIVIGRSGRRTA